MQKMTKGAIAAAAAALLLVGGGGTFMSWNQDAPITGDTITAGRLTLTAAESPTWTLNDVTVSDIDGVRIVPGDVLKFSHVATIDAVGDSIQGELTLVDGTISPVTAGPGVDQQLADALSGEGSAISFAIETEETGLTPVEGSPGVYEFTEAGEYDAALTATFDFGFDSVSGLLAQGGAVSFQGMQLSLDQTNATP